MPYRLRTLALVATLTTSPIIGCDDDGAEAGEDGATIADGYDADAAPDSTPPDACVPSGDYLESDEVGNGNATTPENTGLALDAPITIGGCRSGGDFDVFVFTMGGVTPQFVRARTAPGAQLVVMSADGAAFLSAFDNAGITLGRLEPGTAYRIVSRAADGAPLTSYQIALDIVTCDPASAVTLTYEEAEPGGGNDVVTMLPTQPLTYALTDDEGDAPEATGIVGVGGAHYRIVGDTGANGLADPNFLDRDTFELHAGASASSAIVVVSWETEPGELVDLDTALLSPAVLAANRGGIDAGIGVSAGGDRPESFSASFFGEDDEPYWMWLGNFVGATNVEPAPYAVDLCFFE